MKMSKKLSRELFDRLKEMKHLQETQLDRGLSPDEIESTAEQIERLRSINQKRHSWTFAYRDRHW